MIDWGTEYFCKDKIECPTSTHNNNHGTNERTYAVAQVSKSAQGNRICGKDSESLMHKVVHGDVVEEFINEREWSFHTLIIENQKPLWKRFLI